MLPVQGCDPQYQPVVPVVVWEMVIVKGEVGMALDILFLFIRYSGRMYMAVKSKICEYPGSSPQAIFVGNISYRAI